MNTPSIVKKLGVACAVYLVAAWVSAYVLLGIVRAPNNIVILTPLAYLGGGILWLASMVAVVLGVCAVIRRRYGDGIDYFFAATLTFFTPVIARGTTPIVIRWAEIRDLQRAGIEALRKESAALAELSKTNRYPGSYFGGVVPSEDIPPTLRALAVPAATVRASEDGVVIAVDGMGSWRGGYMITPSDSKFVPEQSRQITEGVYYVITR